MKPALGTVCVALALLAGCAGPATFVSPEPPREAYVDAVFPRTIERVRVAVREAMIGSGLTIVPEETSRTVVVAERTQVPYIGEDAGAPAAGPLPVYRVRAALSARGPDTHVRVAVVPRCPACDGSTPYEWEYPVDLIRSVLDATRSKLGHRGPRIQYPPRFVPRRWRP